MLVHSIADYGVGDLAFAEVVQRIKLYLPDDRLSRERGVPSSAISTINAPQTKLSHRGKANRLSSLKIALCPLFEG